MIHPTGLSVIIGLYTLLQIGLGWFSRQYPNVLGYASNIAPEEIVRLTNIERMNQDLPEVWENRIENYSKFVIYLES